MKISVNLDDYKEVLRNFNNFSNGFLKGVIDVEIDEKEIFKISHPVGIIVPFANDIDPNTLGGTWERTAKGETLVGVNEESAGLFKHPNVEGGDEYSPNLFITGQQYGGIVTGNNNYVGRVYVTPPTIVNNKDMAINAQQSLVQPYITCYYWKRTA